MLRSRSSPRASRSSQEPHLPRPHAGRRRPRSELARSMGARAGARSTGVDYDVRKDKQPYLFYGEVDFEVPSARTATPSTASWSLEEIRQSVRIILQSLDLLKKIGEDARRRPGQRRRPAHRPAAQGRGLHDHRGDHRHFKLVMEGVERPRGRGLLATPRAATASSASSSCPRRGNALPRPRPVAVLPQPRSGASSP